MKNTKLLVLFVVFVVIGFLAASLWRGWAVSRAERSFAELPLENGLLVDPVDYQGTTYLVPPDQLYDSGITSATTPAIDEPMFDSVSTSDEVLADEVLGVIIPTGTVARFYSYQILNWHEVVNEVIGETPVAVTLCPLCRSSAVYSRMVDGTELHFEISGKVYNNNTVLRDRETGSLWLQATGKAIAGDYVGTQLERIPAPVMNWGDFKDAFADAEALSINTGFNKEYERHPYMNYDVAETIYFPLNHSDNRLVNKWSVNGVEINDDYLAVAEKIIENDPVQMDMVGGESIVALHDRSTGVTSIFKPVTTDGQVLTFHFDFEEKEIKDETGTLWSPFGLALEGPLEGQRLEQIAAPDMFWFCWSSLHPDTRVNQLDK